MLKNKMNDGKFNFFIRAICQLFKSVVYKILDSCINKFPCPTQLDRALFWENRLTTINNKTITT